MFRVADSSNRGHITFDEFVVFETRESSLDVSVGHHYVADLYSAEEGTPISSETWTEADLYSLTPIISWPFESLMSMGQELLTMINSKLSCLQTWQLARSVSPPPSPLSLKSIG